MLLNCDSGRGGRLPVGARGAGRAELVRNALGRAEPGRVEPGYRQRARLEAVEAIKPLGMLLPRHPDRVRRRGACCAGVRLRRLRSLRAERGLESTEQGERELGLSLNGLSRYPCRRADCGLLGNRRPEARPALVGDRNGSPICTKTGEPTMVEGNRITSITNNSKAR